MHQRTIELVMPDDMAQILVDDGLGELTFSRRSTALTILTDSASITSVSITLLQGPATITQVARAIKKWIDGRREDAAESDEITITPKDGEAGTINANTEVAVIIAILQAAVIVRDERPSSEDIEGMTI
jgi:hypothetical protein